MKFKVDREKFRKVLSVVKLAQGTGSVTNNEWVKGIKIEIENKDSIRFTATDTNSIISAVLDNVIIENEGNGSILLNGEIIDKITSMQSDSELLVEVQDNVAKLYCGKDKSEFELMRVDDFIGIDLSITNEWFSLPVKSFLMADSDVSFAACKDSGTRPKMQGIYFITENNSMDIVACDGRKLSKLVLKSDSIIRFNRD
jgi:DNA polymerase III sliding clamp (beta) subunit (PCNA family)